MELTRAKEIVSILADGIDPLTGELLPDDHVCNKSDVVRALHTILHIEAKKERKTGPENAGKPWLAEDDEVLCQMFENGTSKKDICNHFKRTEGSIASRLVRIGKINNRDEFRMK